MWIILILIVASIAVIWGRNGLKLIAILFLLALLFLVSIFFYYGGYQPSKPIQTEARLDSNGIDTGEPQYYIIHGDVTKPKKFDYNYEVNDDFVKVQQ